MTKKQKRFVDEYLIDLNATQAAIRAGYSKKTAKSIGQRLLTVVDVKKHIEEQLAKISDDKVADAREIMEYLTSVIRGESRACVVVVEGIGDGCSVSKTICKPPDEKERLKAAELLGKRYGMYNDKLKVDGTIPVVINEDL